MLVPADVGESLCWRWDVVRVAEEVGESLCRGLESLERAQVSVWVSLDNREMWATARWGASWVEKGLETETGGGRSDRATN